MPVSVSTDTSAICTPPTPLFISGSRPPRFLPWALIGTAPIFAQASFQLRAFEAWPFTRTWPFTASSCSGVDPSAGAPFANSASRASPEARRVVGDRGLVRGGVGARRGERGVVRGGVEWGHAELVRQVVECGHSDQAGLRMVWRTPRACRAYVVDDCGPLNAIVGNAIANKIRD